MLKLLNTSDFYTNESNKKKIDYYRKNYGFDGFEFIKFSDNENLEIKDELKGYHLRFFPMWIDLYLNRKEILEKEILEDDTYKYVCGGKTKDEMLAYYKKELETAHKLDVEYVVLHACNIRLSETYTYNFEYSDMEVLKVVTDIVNEIFLSKYKFKLLLENLWWPGLKLTCKEEVKYLLSNIKYKNVGFMLDTGHMINNNPKLRNSDEAVKYIENSIANLGEYKNYIKGVHLNYSLSGEYIENVLNGNGEKEVYKHIGKIDYHDPFEHEGVNKILNSLPLDFLIYEMISTSDEELEEKVKRQELILNNINKKLED